MRLLFSSISPRLLLTASLLCGLAAQGCASDPTHEQGTAFGIDDGASAGQATAAVVSVEKGATLKLKSGAELSVAPGSVDKEIELSIARPKDSDALELVKTLDVKDTPASAPYVLTPHGTTFKKAVTLKLPIAKGADQKKLGFMWLSDEKDTVWKQAGAAKVVDDKASIDLAHFSVLILVERDAPAESDAGSTLMDASVEPDASVSVMDPRDASTPLPPPIPVPDACVSSFACASSPACGVVVDNCGTSHDLSAECAKDCGDGGTCADNTCAPPACVPATCAQALANAGVTCHPMLPDGCGNWLDCSACSAIRGAAQSCVDVSPDAGTQWACAIPCVSDADCPPSGNYCAGHDLTVEHVTCYAPSGFCAWSAVLADCTNGCMNDACY